MALRAEEALAISQAYTKATMQGAGAIKGDKGDKGDTGATGANGADGQDGFSPSIEVKESTAEKYVLTVKNKDGEFDTPNLKVGGSGSANAVTDLEDVILTSLKDGQILKYNSTAGKWVNADGIEIKSLGDIADVELNTPENGQVIVWDDVNKKWVNGTGGGANLSDYETSWSGTHDEWDTLSDNEKDKYEIVHFTDDTNIGIVTDVCEPDNPNAISSQGTYAAIKDKLTVTDTMPTPTSALKGATRLYVGADEEIVKDGIYECRETDTGVFDWVLTAKLGGGGGEETEELTTEQVNSLLSKL